MGPGGRKVVALGITLIVLILGGILVAGGTEEIGDFFDELAQKDEGANEQTITLEDTTLEDTSLPEPAVPEQPVDPAPAPEAESAPDIPDDVDDQFEDAQRQLQCIADAPDAEAMAKCVEPPG